MFLQVFLMGTLTSPFSMFPLITFIFFLSVCPIIIWRLNRGRVLNWRHRVFNSRSILYDSMGFVEGIKMRDWNNFIQYITQYYAINQPYWLILTAAMISPLASISLLLNTTVSISKSIWSIYHVFLGVLFIYSIFLLYPPVTIWWSSPYCNCWSSFHCYTYHCWWRCLLFSINRFLFYIWPVGCLSLCG